VWSKADPATLAKGKISSAYRKSKDDFLVVKTKAWTLCMNKRERDRGFREYKKKGNALSVC